MVMPPHATSDAELGQWLAQTVEAPLLPELPIVDAHFHFWHIGNPAFTVQVDTAEWWEAEREEGGLLARYLVDEMAADIAGSGHKIVATVFVDCGFNYRSEGPAAFRSVGETKL